MLAALPRRAFLDVELKGYPGRGAVDVLTAGRGPGLERAVVSSFEPDALERVGRLAPSWPRWLNAMDLSDATIGAGSRAGLPRRLRGLAGHRSEVGRPGPRR